MTRQETRRAISDITRAINVSLGRYGTVPKTALSPGQVRILLKTKKALQKELTGWLDGDPEPEIQK